MPPQPQGRDAVPSGLSLPRWSIYASITLLLGLVFVTGLLLASGFDSGQATPQGDAYPTTPAADFLVPGLTEADIRKKTTKSSGNSPTDAANRLRRQGGQTGATIFLRQSPAPPALSVAELTAVVRRAALAVRVLGLLADIRQIGLDPTWIPLLDRLAEDGFDRREMEKLFARLGPQSYSPAYMAAKIRELYGVGGVGVNRNDTPAPEPPDDFAQPVKDVTVGSCLEFMKEYEEVLSRAQERHGVPPSVILAVLLIETSLGMDLGNDTALRALAGMAATTTPELLATGGNSRQKNRVRPGALQNTLKQKSNWAYAELLALIRYARDNGYDAAKLPCSIYGAIGLCQFMPSNVGRFAVDGDGDGKIDLFSLPDAIFSVANYLESNGWRRAKTDRQKQAVIYTYNHDNYYASSVLATSKRLERAKKGKVSLQSNALIGGGGRRNPSARLDPSLRRGRPAPRAAQVKSLGDYQGLLQ